MDSLIFRNYLIQFISFLKDTGKSWNIFYQFMEFRHLNTIGILSFLANFV